MYCTLTVLIKCSLGHNFFLLVVFQDFFEKEIWLVGWEKKCKDPFLQTLNVSDTTIELHPTSRKIYNRFNVNLLFKILFNKSCVICMLIFLVNLMVLMNSFTWHHKQNFSPQFLKIWVGRSWSPTNLKQMFNMIALQLLIEDFSGILCI